MSIREVAPRLEAAHAIDPSRPVDPSQPINLARASNGEFRPGRPKIVIGLWILTEWLLVTNPLQLSSRVRVLALRLFGAQIGRGVIMRPRLRVKFPWRLRVGDRCWIGEGVWLHNQGQLTIGADSVVSQESFVTTGSHDILATMDLVVRPVTIGRGVWVTSRCMVLAGVRIADNAVVLPGAVVDRSLGPQGIYGGVPARFVRHRVMMGAADNPEPSSLPKDVDA